MKRTKQSINDDRLTFGGLLAISTICAIQLITSDPEKMGMSLWIATYAFAVSIPCLAAALMILETEVHYEETVEKWYETAVQHGGGFGSFVGVAAAFWHFSWIVGSLFVAASIFGLCSCAAFTEAIEAANKKEEPEKKTDT